MILTNFNRYVVIFTSFFASGYAFWWSAPATERTPTVKQIPVGYFRTYTYQPLSSYPGAYSYPSYLGAQQNMMNNPNAYSMWTQQQSAPSGLRMSTPAPTIHPLSPPQSPTPTQPPNPPQSTYLPTIQQANTPPPPSSPPILDIQPPSQNQAYSQLNSIQQNLNSPQMRPTYPSTDPSNYQYYGNMQQQYAVQQIQFVPCMCPVSVAVSSDYPESRSTNGLDDLQMDTTDQTSSSMASSSMEDAH